MGQSAEREYRKILIARLSPQNRCRGAEGAWLVPALPGERARLRLGGDHHVFVSLPERSRNAFGWVAELPEGLTAAALRAADLESLARCAPETPVVDPLLQWYSAYLDAIDRYPAGTPFGCYWMKVRFPRARPAELRFHKVFFYEPRD